MGSKDNFTAERVAGFKCEPGKQQTIYWDGKLVGLGLRVTQKGTKAYIFEGRLKGKTIRMTIGSPAVWPLESQWRYDQATGKEVLHSEGAREKAKQYSTQLDNGINPAVKKREDLAAIEAERAEKLAAIEAERMAKILQEASAKAEDERLSVTLGDVWPLYIQARRDKWSPLHLRDHEYLASRGGELRKRSKEKTAPGPLAALLDLRLVELDAPTLQAWLTTEAKHRPTAAALSYRLLRAAIGWIDGVPQYTGMVPQGAITAPGVRQALPRPRVKYDDCLESRDLASWFASVRKIQNPVISAYLQALLLTGARRDALASLKWADVDFTRESIRVKDKERSKREQRVAYSKVPLPPYVASLLRDLQRINETAPTVRYMREMEATGRTWEPSPWVFFSKTAKTGRLQEPRPAHVEALEDAGLPHMTLHGLRRSFASFCESIEVPDGISRDIQLHAPQGVREKAYIRRPIDLLRKWHIKIEAWILHEAGIEQPSIEPGKLQLVATGA